MVHKCWFTLRIEILVNFYNILVNYGQNQEIFQEKCNFLEEISWSLISCFLVFYQEMCNSTTDLVFSKCANSKILILKFFLVCSFSNKLCNVHGTTSECSEDNCKCKSSYTGNLCEFCNSKSVIWNGMNGTIEPKSGLGVECGKFEC